MRVALIIIWSFLKKGDLFGLVAFYLRTGRNRLHHWLHDHPLSAAKLLRFAPLMLAIGVLLLTARYGSLDSPVIALATCFSVALSLWIAAPTIAVLSLSGPLLLPFMRAWRHGALRILSFFVPAFAVVLWYRGQPVQQLMGAGAILLLWFMFYGLVEYFLDALRWQSKRRLKRLDIGKDRLQLNDAEYWRICVHEAGHLLLYGQFDALPEDAIAVVDREPKYGFGGFVTPIHTTEAIDATTDVLLWQATMAYAGAAAERSVFGAHCEGASKDYEMADEFIVRLAKLSHTAYFSTPANPTQESANIMAICRLRSECQQRAEEFIAHNKEQLMHIAQQLRLTECVNCEDFFPVWQTLVLPQCWKKLVLPARIPRLDSDGRTTYSLQSTT